MPLLWTNKNRVSQLFQIVADLHSSKPTAASLIDLFVKNRTHFKKFNSNKPSHRSHPTLSETPYPSDENLHANDGVVDSDRGVVRNKENNDGLGSKSVLVTFFMMVVVFVSIMSFEKLTVGITVSAFFLLFLQYAADSLSFEEIKVVAADSSSFEDIKVVVGVCSKDTSSCHDHDLTLDCSELKMHEYNSNKKIVDSCQVSLHENNNKGSHSVKLKSKLKKLLPKKFQGSRKERKEKRGKECQIESTKIESSDFELRKKVVDCGSKSTLLVNHVKVENMRVNNEEKRIDRVWKSSECAILFLIAFVGLVLGRFPAFILTMTWCFMLKMLTIRGRFFKVPLMNCSKFLMEHWMMMVFGESSF